MLPVAGNYVIYDGYDPAYRGQQALVVEAWGSSDSYYCRLRF